MIAFYLLVLLGLGIYSYSQIDLNLTLLQAPWFLQFQNTMIRLGYYNRPLSTVIFLIIIALSFICYLFLLKKEKYPRNSIWILLIISVIALLSYPFLSHDFFNYLFDARILTFYHQNPYLFKALDFPDDTWIRFMHWTHRAYPYGPVWLLLSLPFSFFGFGKFVLTALNFKMLFLLFYLGSAVLIKKILDKISPDHALMGVTFFAANPLVIIESLVSPHLDSAMAFFFLLAVYLFIVKKKFFAFAAVLASGGIKFLTLITLPLFFKLSVKKLLGLSLLLVLIGLLPVIWQREVYPWYFLTPISIISLLVEHKKLIYLTVAASLGLVLHYAPLLYVGQEVIMWENILTVTPLLLCALGLIFYRPR